MKACFKMLLGCLVSIIFILTSCTAEKTKKEGTVFYFYPEADAYYDVANNLYYLLDKNNGWEEVTDLSPTQEAALGPKVLMPEPQKPIWKNYDQDRLLYSVAVHTSPQEFQKQYYEDSINSLPKKVKTEEEKDNEGKVRSGLGKFLEKVFSKKDKKQKGNQ